jgi:hypothetical protein
VGKKQLVLEESRWSQIVEAVASLAKPRESEV